MIQELRIDIKDREKERQQLVDAGFISATALYGKEPTDLWDMGLNPSLMPTAWDLNQFAKEDSRLMCYRLTYNGKKGSYWYKLSDLYSLYGADLVESDDTYYPPKGSNMLKTALWVSVGVLIVAGILMLILW